jgi:hypothetical protein
MSNSAKGADARLSPPNEGCGGRGILIGAGPPIGPEPLSYILVISANGKVNEEAESSEGAELAIDDVLGLVVTEACAHISYKPDHNEDGRTHQRSSRGRW